MLVADLALGQGLVGLLKGGQVAGQPQALHRRRGREAAPPAQPGDGGGGALGGILAGGLEAPEAMGEHGFEAVHGAPERDELPAEGGAGEVGDLRVELVHKCLIEHMFA